jgi:hypothetical protein
LKNVLKERIIFIKQRDTRKNESEEKKKSLSQFSFLKKTPLSTCTKIKTLDESSGALYFLKNATLLKKKINEANTNINLPILPYKKG